MRNRKNLVFAGLALVALAAVWCLSSRRGGPAPADATARRADRARTASRPAGLSARVAAAGTSAPTNSVAGAPLSPRGTKTVRVTADRTVTAGLRRALSDLGARVIAPVGPRAVLVEATPEACRKIARDSRFTAEDVLPAAKVQGLLARQCAERPADSVKVSVLGLSEGDRGTLAAFVRAAGGRVIHSPLGAGALAAEVSPALVAELAGRGDVRWIESAPEPCLLNDQTAVKAGANVDTLRTVHKLLGHGQSVTVCDTGLDTGLADDIHLDFAGRVKEIVHIGKTSAEQAGYTATLADCNGHGTHVAGTVLGDGARSDGLYKGMAPAADLYFQSTSDTKGEGLWFDSYADFLSQSVENESYIHSNSWGSKYVRDVYDAVDSEFDAYLWKHPELLVVVAAGNAGEEGSGDHTICSHPSCAKNVLTVGNTMSSRPTDQWLLEGNPENLNATSSRGPTADGRIKPEVAAPGTAVYSTLSSKCSDAPLSNNVYYTEMTGTSMACPLVSGTAALVREWLAGRRGMAERPTAALMKAILAGGGVAMTGVGARKDGMAWTEFNLPQELPNTDYGWGRVNLEETLYPTNGRAVRFADRIPFRDGGSWTLDVVTTNAAPLDVQLCWIDHPSDASTDAGRTLINDLDLVVSNKTTGAVWHGNGIEGGDRTNTMESVRIAASEAPAGEYAVIVSGAAVPYGSDEGGAAAVYVRGAFADETSPDPLYIRNVRTDERYEYLDDALKGVLDGDTLEILHPVALDRSVTLSVSCTIVATNADPAAALVTRADDASLTLAAGATLTLSNVVFAAGGSDPAVTAEAGARLVLSGTAGVGQVTVADAETIRFVAPLTLTNSYLFVDAPNGCGLGDAFGTFTGGDALAVSNAAALVRNVRDDELGGVAEDGGQLVWGVVPCDPSVATCLVESEDGTAAFASFSKALRVAVLKDSRMTVRKQAQVTNVVTLAHRLELVGDGGELAFSADFPDSGFVIPAGASLVLTNITVSGEGADLDDCAFKVTGGELTLERDATLSGLCDAYSDGKSYGGAVVVNPGRFAMKSGSRIEDCESQHSGGAIYASGFSGPAVLDLLGGTIEGCSARNESGGGAVYAAPKTMKAAASVEVNVAGDFTATDNTMNDESPAAGNLFLSGGTVFTLTDRLTGAVGVSFGPSSGLNDAGAEFVTVADPVPAEAAKASEANFSCDADCELVARLNATGTAIAWSLETDDGQCEPGEENYVVEIGGDRTIYRWLADAFGHVYSNATVYVLDRGDHQLTAGVEVRHPVVLVSSNSQQCIRRLYDSAIRVVSGGSLTMTNIQLRCATEDATNSLVLVSGGALTLSADSRLFGVSATGDEANGSRAANAVTVSGGGTLTMEPGSYVGGCTNSYVSESDATGCGGGILLDRSTAYFRGGTVEACRAYRAGGVYVANGSTAYVSGGFTASDNRDLTGRLNNVVVADDGSKLVLDGPFTGSAGLNEGLASDTNVFASVSSDWTAWSVPELGLSAARFTHDFTGATGVAVTNGTEALLVWSTALKEDSGGRSYYEEASGRRYVAVDGGDPTDPPGPEPAPASVTTNYPTPVAFQSVACLSATELRLVVTNRVPWCRYRLLHTDNLAKGFTATNEWEQARGTDPAVWTNDVSTSDGHCFWSVEGTWGIVPEE